MEIAESATWRSAGFPIPPLPLMRERKINLLVKFQPFVRDDKEPADGRELTIVAKKNLMGRPCGRAFPNHRYPLTS